jgi:hypothetical protein
MQYEPARCIRLLILDLWLALGQPQMAQCTIRDDTLRQLRVKIHNKVKYLGAPVPLSICGPALPSMQYEPTRNILLLILDLWLAPGQPRMAQRMIRDDTLRQLRMKIRNNV